MEIKDISNEKLSNAEKVMSAFNENEKQVILDKLFATLLNSWKKSFEGGKNE